jgi:hypothetical protein
MAEVVGSSPTSSIDPDGGRTAGTKNVGSIASRPARRTTDLIGRHHRAASTTTGPIEQVRHPLADVVAERD